MFLEIERKFLVEGFAWRHDVRRSTPLRQGYLAEGERAVVRVRRCGDTAVLTVKGRRAGRTRDEIEVPLDLPRADALLRLCGDAVVEKIRHEILVGDRAWIVDEFLGRNAGLVLAEVELASEDEEVVLPFWVRAEVTDDERYYNAALANHPYETWGAEEPTRPADAHPEETPQE